MSSSKQELAAILMDYQDKIPDQVYIDILNRLRNIPNHKDPKKAAELQKEIDTLVKQVKAFVKDYGKKNGYTFILGANEAGSVMYGADDKDITEDVIKALNGDTKEESKTKE